MFDEAAGRPPGRNRHQVQGPGAYHAAHRLVVCADEHRLAPFDNVKVRQAVNYAIDRNTLVNLFGGPVLASPVCQVLPPGFPGHEDYCPYTKNPGAKWSAPDMEKAKQLVEESGTKGQKVTIIAEDTAVSKSIGVYLQSVLTELGYDTDVKPISSNIQFTYIQNTNNKVQMSVTQWYQDYPAASDFLNILFGCSTFREGLGQFDQHCRLLRQGYRRQDAGGACPWRDRSGRPPTRCGPRSTRR